MLDKVQVIRYPVRYTYRHPVRYTVKMSITLFYTKTVDDARLSAAWVRPTKGVSRTTSPAQARQWSADEPIFRLCQGRLPKIGPHPAASLASRSAMHDLKLSISARYQPVRRLRFAG